MWSSLPSNLRTVLGTALLLGLGVAAAAFTLSFFALRDAAADPALAWGSGHAWLFPIGVDMALVFFEVLLLGASMVRITEQRPGRPVPPGHPVPAHAGRRGRHPVLQRHPRPHQVRPLALAVPVASDPGHPRPRLPAQDAGRRLGRRRHPPRSPGPGAQPHRPPRDVLHGELVRDPEVPGLYGPAGAAGHMPSWAPSQLDQNGPPAVTGDGSGDLSELTKRHQVEAYLAALGPDQLGRLTTLGPRAAARELTGTLTSQGIQVSERYVQQILDDWTAATRQQAKGRRRAR